jgi:hypothetical protein
VFEGQADDLSSAARGARSSGNARPDQDAGFLEYQLKEARCDGRNLPLDLVETRTLGSRVIYERYRRVRDDSN